MFQDREDAALRLVTILNATQYRDPLVIAVSGGGAITGATVAEKLDAEFDLVLVRHLRAPRNPNLSIGAIAETGDLFLNEHAHKYQTLPEWFRYLQKERETRLIEIQQLACRTHAVQPPAHVTGRSVIVVDEGVNTGARMIAALKAVRSGKPFELIAAAPVIPQYLVSKIADYCDQVLALETPEPFAGIASSYISLPAVDDECLCATLRRAVHQKSGRNTRDEFRTVSA